jgi:DNA-binding transcriptional MerR regulator
MTGISYQTLHLWAKSGFIPPSITPASGRGSERVYSFADLVALRVAAELRKSGVSTRSLKEITRYLRQRGFQNPMAETKLVIVGSDVVLVENQEQLISALNSPGQSCLKFVVDIGKTCDELTNWEVMQRPPAANVEAIKTQTTKSVTNNRRIG